MFKKRENIENKRLEYLVNKYDSLLRYIKSSNKYKVDYTTDNIILFKCTEHLINSDISDINSTLKGHNDYLL